MDVNRELTAEVAVVGGGPAGLVCAIALKTAGVDTLLIAPPARPDHRTTALLAGSVTALETLGVWQACVPQAAPLKKLCIVDDTRRLFRAPEVFFEAAEIGLDAFGYNIENGYLFAALEAPRRRNEIAADCRSGARDQAAMRMASRSNMPTVKRGCGSRSVPTVRARSAAPRRALPHGGELSADGADAQSRACAARTTTPRPNSIPKAVHSRWYPCPAAVRAWFACSIRRAPPNSPR